MDIVVFLNEEVFISAGVFNSLLIVALLCLFFAICGKKMKQADPTKPSTGLLLLIELLVTSIHEMCHSIMGDKKGRLGPFMGTLIIYLLSANLLGLVGLTTPTSNFNVTFALAVFALCYLIILNIRINGLLTYMKDTFVGDFPILLPLNIIGELAKFLSLSLRLFGNIVSGGMILGVLMHLTGWLILPVLPALNFYFDIFSGLLQTLIFCFLLMIWAGDLVATDE
ncbi:MAG: F0F1 ATP synthase subunit A [Defluviitaleaceae bacterium]|nr:F0F1 ATP synthase subunit A [Defluviitaleaceae bacterium]